MGIIIEKNLKRSKKRYSAVPLVEIGKLIEINGDLLFQTTNFLISTNFY